MLGCFNSAHSDIAALHDTALAYGHVVGKSTHSMSAAFDDPEQEKALIVQLSQSETPTQSERSNQLDVGYLLTDSAYEAGELITRERAIPKDTNIREGMYRAVTLPTDMSPPDLVEYVRLHGKIDEIDALLGAQLSYPANEQETSKAYGELCMQLLTVIEPKLLEIALR